MTEDCRISQERSYARVYVGPSSTQAIQECYRSFVHDCLKSNCARALVIGASDGDPFDHLVVRDVIGSMAVAGVPAEFRLAFVAQTANLIAIYDAALVEAQRLGMQARRFMDEAAAALWLDEQRTGGPADSR